MQALDQGIEFGIAIQCPPVAPLQRVSRRRTLPALDLPELCRLRQLGTLIVRPQGTATQYAGQQQGDVYSGKGSSGHSGVSNEASVRTPRQRLTR